MQTKLPRSHGGDHVAAALEAQGVRHLFTLCGGHISPILTAAKARTGNVPIPFTFTGTAKNLDPLSGTWASPHMCSTIGISAPSNVV